MNILAIETSCDDTCVAIIEALGKKGGHFNILSNIVSSQVKIHQKWGGVYPTLAKREHQRNLLPVLIKALRETRLLRTQSSKVKSQNYILKLKTLEKIFQREKYLFKELGRFFKRYQKPKIDLIAVTVGPGLEPCLWTGVNLAKAIAFYWDMPLITVNHIKAHIFAYEINKKTLAKKDFPVICLIVSGGHTQIFLMEDFGKYKILGETRDDAAGECFDKTARILGLGYPGGPAIAANAAKLKIKKQPPGESASRPAKFKITLPRPMISQKNYDFSFSGLKTAVLYNFRSQPKKIQKDKNYIKTISAEIQQSIIDVLIKKTMKAAKNYNAKTIILGGGVTANEELRKQFKNKIKKDLPNIKYLIPNIQFCTDNAAMVAIAGYFRLKKRGEAESWQDIKAEANLKIL